MEVLGIFCSQMAFYTACDTIHTVRNRSEVSSWQKERVWVPESSGSWLPQLRLLQLFFHFSILLTFHLQQHSQVTISHNRFTMLQHVNIIIKQVVQINKCYQALHFILFCRFCSQATQLSREVIVLASITKIGIHNTPSLLGSHHKFSSQNSDLRKV